MMITNGYVDCPVFTIEQVHQTATRLLSRKVNDMTKVKVKCWLYHSESRSKNGNEPFLFDVFHRQLGKNTYLEYINRDFIDCEDMGGKEQAMLVVEKWFS